MTPFEAMYGRTPPSIVLPGTSKVATLDEMLQSHSQILTRLKANINHAQQQIRHQANKHRRDVTFTVDEFPYIKLRPYRQLSVHRRYSPKLVMRYYESYRITEKIGEVAYRLGLPPKAKIHNVFHVSMLKSCPNPHQQTPAALPDCFLGMPAAPQPLKQLSTRTIRRGGSKVRQVLIQWVDQTPNDATWEDVALLCQNFPTFRLEDEVVSKGGRDDTVTGGLLMASRQRRSATCYPSNEYILTELDMQAGPSNGSPEIASGSR
ncbi:unnamed protein product [Rhodiola kirilowii]